MLNLFFWFYNQLSKLLDGKDSKILQSNAKKKSFLAEKVLPLQTLLIDYNTLS